MKPRMSFSSDHFRAVRLAAAAAFVIAVLFGVIPSAQAQSNADCLGCHGDRSLEIQKAGKTISLYVDVSALKETTHGKLMCMTCHEGFDGGKTPHKASIQPVNCISCHPDVKKQHQFHGSFIPAGTWEARSAACKSCHGTHVKQNLIASCGRCHAEVVGKFVRSAHGKALVGGVEGAPNCFACHKNHIVETGDGRSPAKLKMAQEKVCLSCHLENPKVSGRTVPRAAFIKSYEQSVHGAALLRGNGAAANCIDCHGSHAMRTGADPDSRVSKAHIPETCGKCHADEAKEYAQSIHGVVAARGSPGAPVCTSCHGEHRILGRLDPKSPVAPRNLSAQVCGTCHSSVKLSEKYGIRSDRFQTFSDSYHGLAIRGGSVNAANCASCHGSHGIKPSSDPTSMISKANIPKTCGKCHPGANERFAMGKVHVSMIPKQQPVLYAISVIYILLIVGVVGGMLAHNALDWFMKYRQHIRGNRQGALHVRMSRFERVQHLGVMLSFIVLAVTGFLLHYPDAWWVAGIRSLNPNLFELRGILHRGAAVVMVLACLVHVLYALFTTRGRELVCDMLPRRQDIHDTIGMVKHYLGLCENKPRLGRFSYIEKSEYWALVWGSVIMTLTGLIMWMENTFIGLLTKLGWDIARTVHFYEAWLAVLAIIVWHLYFVIFNPDVYPGNAAWLVGTLSDEELEKEHPLEYEKLRQKKVP